MDRKLPMYPIFIKDPNFSLWSASDCLNESNLKSWYGETKTTYGFLKVNGETYCFLGNAQDFCSCGVKKAKQLSVDVTAYSTDYAFDCDGVTLKVRFISPLPLDDLDVLSMPVCYMEYEINGAEQAEISVFLNRNNAYNEKNQAKEVRGGVVPFEDCEAAFIGLKRQLPLSNHEDCIGADWGYFYVGGKQACFLDDKDLEAYLSKDEKEFFYEGAERFIGAWDRASVGSFAIAYDEGISIDYFGEYKKGWYLENRTIFDALCEGIANRRKIVAKLDAFDKELKEKAAHYGEHYYNVLTASLRQSIGGHKLIKDKDGKPLFLSKENGSNGCIATVDVSYPSMPLFLFYNTELVKGMLRPILTFARMPVWSYDFAPHDVGTYPACCGQVYGLNTEKTHYHGDFGKDTNGLVQTHFPIYLFPAAFDAYSYEMQMPVEECADMIIMFCACFQRDGDIRFFAESKDLCEKWVTYLVEYGLKPENQLCTDDFAGHLANNINLAIKATVGIGAYAELAKAVGDTENYQKYRAIAEQYASEIEAFGKQYAHIPLTWDSDDSTFSLKYNFAFDKVLKLGLFSQDTFEREVDCYIARMNEYGTPLDSRKDYTKSDWLLWAAALTDCEEKRRLFVEKLDNFLKNSPDRVPFSDWFETVGGAYHYFRARTTQGGCFIFFLLSFS